MVIIHWNNFIFIKECSLGAKHSKNIQYVSCVCFLDVWLEEE